MDGSVPQEVSKTTQRPPYGPARSHRESDDQFEGVVVMVSDRLRVIDSLERHPYRQWIIQAGVAGQDRWKSQSFCQYRSTLLRNLVGKADPAVIAILEALPERSFLTGKELTHGTTG